MGGSNVAAVPWGWVWELQGVPSAGLPSVGIDGCGWVHTEIADLSSEKGSFGNTYFSDKSCTFVAAP